MTAIRIGTRGSRLALWQAQTVARLLGSSDVPTEIVVIKTTGDRIQDAPLSESGGKRLFVKEIEDALLRGEVDVAVHSAKDMPAVLPDGLAIGATLEREDPRDAIILGSDRGHTGVRPESEWGQTRVKPGSNPGQTLVELLSDPSLSPTLALLGPRPTIGTSSVRRTAQLAAVLPNAIFTPVRGNVDTRLCKLDDGRLDALVLAIAGIRRLGFEDRISAALPFDLCVPAPGQGIVAAEVRADDRKTRERVGTIHHPASGLALAAERALVVALGGGCQLPLGAVAVDEDGALVMHAVVASLDGRRIVRRSARGPSDDPGAIGRRLADEMIAAGAGDILNETR
jgi:hydroxymethylbilane synthase